MPKEICELHTMLPEPFLLPYWAGKYKQALVAERRSPLMDLVKTRSQSKCFCLIRAGRIELLLFLALKYLPAIHIQSHRRMHKLRIQKPTWIRILDVIMHLTTL
jgi:hypothetical protein